MNTPNAGTRLTRNPKSGRWEVVDRSNFLAITHVNMPWGWVEASALLPGKALVVAALICLVKDLRQNSQITLPKAALSRCRISKAALSRALLSLESAGLIKVSRRLGAKSVITVTDTARYPVRLMALLEDEP